MNVTRKEYLRIHQWLNWVWGPACYCSNEQCPGGGKRFEWALIEGKEHKKDRTHYRPLCSRCHKKVDYANGHYEATRQNTSRLGKQKGSALGKSTRKLTMHQAAEIRTRHQAGAVKQKTLAREYGVDRAVISHIIHNTSYVA